MPLQSGVETIAFVFALIIAITFHEAAHGYVARLFGDYTASRLGRVTLNPLRHIDPLGTIILPGLMLVSGAPFLFGYAKPVPVVFDYLHPRRLGTILVAAAGPGMNLFLAWLSAILIHINYGADSLGNTILLKSVDINIVLAIFNMFPIPPLDGGRVAVALLPNPLNHMLASVERYGFLILLALIILPSMVLQPKLGIYFDPLREILIPAFISIKQIVLFLSGNA
jgi:Zn-dependent protease